MYLPTTMADLDVDVKPFSSVPATVNHREAKPETETANSEASKGRAQSVSYMYIPYTVDREIFAEVYFCVLNFSAFSFRRLASLYIVAIARKKFSRV